MKINRKSTPKAVKSHYRATELQIQADAKIRKQRQCVHTYVLLIYLFMSLCMYVYVCMKMNVPPTYVVLSPINMGTHRIYGH